MKAQFLSYEGVQATGALRFANLIIDVVGLYVIIFIMTMLAFLISNFGIEGPALWFENISGGEDRIFTIIVLFLYYFVFEITTQRTLGKFITGTMVVNQHGEKPSAKTIASRSLCRLIGLEILTFLGNRRGWHDTASNTFVVKTKKWKELIALDDSFEEIGRAKTDTSVTSIM